MSGRIKASYYERAAEKLLKGMPRPQKFGRVIDGKWMTGHQSQHKTPQAVKWRRFWRVVTQSRTSR